MIRQRLLDVCMIGIQSLLALLSLSLAILDQSGSNHRSGHGGRKCSNGGSGAGGTRGIISTITNGAGRHTRGNVARTTLAGGAACEEGDDLVVAGVIIAAG